MTAAQRAYEAMCAAGYVGMSPKVIAGSIAAWDQLGAAEQAAWQSVADACDGTGRDPSPPVIERESSRDEPKDPTP